MARQLVSFFETNHILGTFQSAYRKGHSTETAMVRILNELRMQMDGGKVTILWTFILLDSSAFNTISHKTLFSLLEVVGVRCIALKWFVSYLW